MRRDFVGKVVEISVPVQEKRVFANGNSLEINEISKASHILSKHSKIRVFAN